MENGQKVYTREQHVPNNFISVQTLSVTRISILVKNFRSNMERASCVKSCKFQGLRKPFTCGEVRKDLPATPSYFYRKERPNKTITCGLAEKVITTGENARKPSATQTHLLRTRCLHWRKALECSEYRKSFSYSSTFDY